MKTMISSQTDKATEGVLSLQLIQNKARRLMKQRGVTKVSVADTKRARELFRHKGLHW